MDATEFYNRLEVEFNTIMPFEIWPESKNCTICMVTTDQIDDHCIADQVCILCKLEDAVIYDNLQKRRFRDSGKRYTLEEVLAKANKD
jgi:hypothetical protein